MKIKVLLWSVVSILIIGLAAGGYWWMSRPQVILFSDDAKLTLVKVEYGKRHAPPAVGKPATGSRGAARGASFTTDRDTLVLWVREQYDSKQYHYFQFFDYDKGGTGCAQAGPRNWRNNGNEVVAVQFDAFPRRQGKFVVRVQEQSNGGQEMSEQKFVVSNPAGGKSIAKWTAEPLPSTKEDDDVSVTLTKLATGADTSYQRNQDNADDAANKGVQAVFHVERNGKPVPQLAAGFGGDDRRDGQSRQRRHFPEQLAGQQRHGDLPIRPVAGRAGMEAANLNSPSNPISPTTNCGR